MSVAGYVIGSAAVCVGAVIGILQYRRLRGDRIRQVITAPSGWPVRYNVFVVAGGVWTLTGMWTVVALPAAVVAWELAVQVTARIGRVPHGRAPRAS
jgi:hypothetical protein